MLRADDLASLPYPYPAISVYQDISNYKQSCTLHVSFESRLPSSNSISIRVEKSNEVGAFHSQKHLIELSVYSENQYQ